MSFVRLSLIVPFVALAGCAKGPVTAASPMNVPPPVVVAPQLAIAAPPVAVPAITSPTKAAAGIGSHVVDRGAPAAADAVPSAADLAADAAPGEEDPQNLIRAFSALEEEPSYKIDDRIPYGVVVSERSAKTATIYWRTEVPTRGIIEYGRSWGFDKNGYTDKFVDDVPKTDHMIALTDLRRWTGYHYKITAVTALGLKFPEKDRQFRTKFWSWR